MILIRRPVDRHWFSPLIHLSNNPLSFIGVLLTTTGGVSWLFVLPAQWREGQTHPYLGILFFLLLPMMFFAGLALIPLGMYLRYRRERREGVLPEAFPQVDWRNQEFRRLVLFVVAATVANVVIGGNFTYAAVHYLDSVSFCGQACHSVMKPEFTAYQDSPHFRVNCVDCHIGTGASWFVKSKLSGVRQVFAVTLNTYSRPIPTPVHDLRPARETCEQCHWPGKFGGYRLRILPKFAEDEQNTPTKTVLLMRVGGGTDISGIHGVHLGPGVVIEYASDPERQKIPWVRYADASGRSKEYATEEWQKAPQANMQHRIMDCVDCHNRPTHVFDLPETAMDRALAAGRVSPSLPLVKKQSLQILKAEYVSAADARAKIPSALEQFYKQERPELYQERQAEIRNAGHALLAIWQRNVFPEMKVTWGRYPNNIGHTEFPGCYRCHDEQHTSKDGKTITQNCNACHQLLAAEEPQPEILKTLGIEGQ